MLPGVWGQSPRKNRIPIILERAPPDERATARSAGDRSKGGRPSTDARREPLNGSVTASGRKIAPDKGAGLRNGRSWRTESGERKPQARGKEQSGSHAPAGRKEREHPNLRERRGARPSDEPRQRQGTRAGTERRARSGAKTQRPTTSGRKQAAVATKGSSGRRARGEGAGGSGGRASPPHARHEVTRVSAPATRTLTAAGWR